VIADILSGRRCLANDPAAEIPAYTIADLQHSSHAASTVLLRALFVELTKLGATMRRHDVRRLPGIRHQCCRQICQIAPDDLLVSRLGKDGAFRLEKIIYRPRVVVSPSWLRHSRSSEKTMSSPRDARANMASAIPLPRSIEKLPVVSNRMRGAASI
jgi:hypothetical protein